MANKTPPSRRITEHIANERARARDSSPGFRTPLALQPFSPHIVVTSHKPRILRLQCPSLSFSGRPATLSLFSVGAASVILIEAQPVLTLHFSGTALERGRIPSLPDLDMPNRTLAMPPIDPTPEPHPDLPGSDSEQALGKKQRKIRTNFDMVSHLDGRTRTLDKPTSKGFGNLNRQKRQAATIDQAHDEMAPCRAEL